MPVFPIPNSALDVCILGTLVTTAKQQHNHIAGQRVIHAIASALVDSQLPHPFATRLVVTEISTFYPIDSFDHLHLDAGAADLRGRLINLLQTDSVSVLHADIVIVSDVTHGFLYLKIQAGKVTLNCFPDDLKVNFEVAMSC